MRVSVPLRHWIGVHSPAGILLGKVHDAVVKVEKLLSGLKRSKPVCSKCGGNLDVKPAAALEPKLMYTRPS
ncbi:hypothetical protein AVEN_247505-1 [Araneus ventricosus]|uniref:Uncharacterized protein n=1 Tax=Araneus ventricosus TaxID=182803 RepID=A0A4Y2LGY2_ARAVE|nr:hypothetical protein AVEN_247505-1 [Araneus ventricosus]